jgi:AcrR family transcriptional regulator
MILIIDSRVNRVRIQTNPEKARKATVQAATRAPKAPARRRMGFVERERQILDAAIEFFAEHGFVGPLRDLAKRIGVTHALLYHYVDADDDLIVGGCGGILGLVYAVSPRLSRYSRGMSEPREILIRFSLYQRM